LSRKPDAGAPRTPDAAGGPTPPHRVHVPRRWLTVILVLLVVPWLIVAAVYVQSTRTATAPEPTVPAPSSDAASGPWGRLVASPIVISPPLEYVSPEGGRAAPPQWFFPGVSRDVVQAFLASSGLPSNDVARLLDLARPAPDIQGLTIAPDPAWIRTMSADVRARIYGELAKSRLNFDQDQSFRFLGASAAEWLDGSHISPDTRALVEPLIYKQGNFLHFADIEAVRSQIKDGVELQRLIKTLQRHSTLLLRLSISSGTDVDRLAQYWGRGGRRTDIRPLLESVAGGGEERSIDVVHLLPTLARNHLYRYPKLTADDFDRPVIANCLWTALNFFRPEADDRFLDPDYAIQTLKRDYYVVEHGFELGDVVAFLDDNGNLFHVAVYIADDIAFSKNGTSPLSPWTFMRIEHIKEYYRSAASDIRLIYHRRSDH
jgi:hypothetical protein